MPSTTFLHLVGMRPGTVVGGDLLFFLDQMETLYTLARKYNERELADKIRQTATGWGMGASKETMKKALDTIHAEVAAVISPGGPKTPGFRKAIEEFIKGAGADPGAFLQSPQSNIGTIDVLSSGGGGASMSMTIPTKELLEAYDEFNKWKEATMATMAATGPDDLVGEHHPSRPPLPAVFMRECPCCGSPVWFDREKDAVTSEKPNVG